MSWYSLLGLTPPFTIIDSGGNLISVDRIEAEVNDQNHLLLIAPRN